MPSLTPDHSLHARLERRLNSDVRLLYGLGVPFLVLTGFIVAFAVAADWWLLPGLMILLVAVIGVVLVGITQMMDEDDDEATR